MKKISLLALLTLFTYQAYSQQSPTEFLGYEPGTVRCTPHYRVIAYYEYLAQQFPRQVKLIQYGKTYENRPLMAAVVASEENFPKLEELRTNHLKSIGLQDGAGSGKDIAISWMSYNIHGNENVSSEAAMIVLYDLLKGDAKDVLKNTIVVLDPCVNPDGYDRYVNGYNQRMGSTPNAYAGAWEHTEPWPGGRVNHYLFDLNRDWAWMVQQESQARNALYQQWMPHVFADFHEQGINSPYFFTPPAKPVHQDVTGWQREFQTIIGDFNRKAFDKNGWLYFTRENFDLFYPSYGDTYPTFNGAIGMTFEQAGNGRAGLAIQKADGDTLTLKERILHHVTASKATMAALSANADKAASEFIKFFSNAKSAPGGTYKTFVVKTKGEDGKIKSFTNYLTKMGFQFGYADKTASFPGSYSYVDDKTATAAVEAGDILISTSQPRSVFLKILMEPKTVLEDSVTYDITSWSLPYAYGLKAYALKEKLTPSATKPATATTLPAIIKPYAYLLRWSSQEDAHLLAHLYRKNLRARVATKEFELEGKKYGIGTVIFTRGENARLGDKFDTILAEEAHENGLSLTPVTSGYVTSGPDLGSNYVSQLKAPKVAILTGEGTSSYSVGEVWHYFDKQLHYPATMVLTGDFPNFKLNDFSVLVLANGNYGRLLNDATIARIKAWVQDGGKLILMEGAVGAFAGKEGFDIAKKEEKKDDKKDDDLKIYGNQEREAVSGDTPGAIYKFAVDNTHPLAYGLPGYYHGLVLSTSEYGFLKNGWNVGYIKKGDAPVSGFVGKDARKKIENTLMFGVQDLGRGQVVYFVNNPLFRGFWYQGKLVFANAVFMVN
ncbi:M14 family metallopeptidase [Siphonobacter aquaeclarae]|uniref:Zinc carboxypeptidase n=1 Tax=Siphonobacter aquaeclarae TaxID=563176 RepID=A0A1G9S3X9_9BACT|nr:M14 family metallopeptidase [Siphonobacter aquaeclarae]SDM30007.1 Zinc carboxypeptidase [Siphonobacter aquaeclarae]